MHGVDGIVHLSQQEIRCNTAAELQKPGGMVLIVAVNFRDLIIYLLATAAAGGAYSLFFVGGLQVISAAAPEGSRGGILSALYLLGYLSMGALASYWALSRQRAHLVSLLTLVRRRSS